MAVEAEVAAKPHVQLQPLKDAPLPDVVDTTIDAKEVCTRHGELRRGCTSPRSFFGPKGSPPCHVCDGVVATAAAAAAHAARSAVEAAFAELQPALIQAVSAGCPQLGQESAPAVTARRSRLPSYGFLQGCAEEQAMKDRPRASLGAAEVSKVISRRSNSGSELDVNENSVARASSLSSRGASVISSRSFMPGCSVCSERTQISAEAADAEHDKRPTYRSSISFDSSAAQRLSHTPPTIRSLEADIAHAVLSQAGYNIVVRGVASSAPSSCKPTATNSSSSLGRGCRILPDHDDPSFVHTPTAGSMASSELAREQPAIEKQFGPRNVMFVPAASSASSPLSPSTSMTRVMSSSSRTELNRMSSSQVLKARCDELALQATHGSLPSFAPSEDGEEQEIRPVSSATGRLPRSVPTMMLVFGLLPWDLERRPCLSATLQWFCRAVIALSTAAFVLLSFGYVEGSGCRENGDGCWQQNGFLSQVPLPIGALMVLILTTLQRHQNALEETIALLLNVSFERRYQAWHSRQTLRDKAVFVAIWFCSFIAACIWNSLLGAQFENIAGRGVLHTIVMSILSAHILSFAYGIVHVCRSLTIMIDAFCCDVVHQDSARRVAHIWNMTQAILRKASVSVEHCLLGLCFVLVFSVPLLLIDVLHTANAPILTMIPTLCVTSGILYVLLLASTISEQCTRVPALVNALSFGEGTEAARQQTVDYISSSAAGFYVFGTRLTTATVLKLMYIWCIVVLGLLTRLSTS